MAKSKLSRNMTLQQFDNGYWYATDLQNFAEEIKIPFVRKLRKDELEQAIKQFLVKGSLSAISRRQHTKGIKDVELGLSLNLPVVNYTNDNATKDFLFSEAQKIDPNFRIKSGTRYLLNRWREQQITVGKKITYKHLVLKLMSLAKTAQGPLRTEHGRYNNFISDWMANKAGTRDQAIRAWKQLKNMDCPKTFAAWMTMKER